MRPALPFALLTNDYNYITAYTLQSATTPADIEIAKYYYKPHVEAITQDLNDALGRGPAAAEEWSKGLAATGKERMRVAENWERWEVKHQWWEEHQQPKRAASATPPLATTSHKKPSKSPTRQMPSPVLHAPVPASKYELVFPIAARNGIASPCFTSTPPMPNLTSAAPSSRYAQARPPTVPPQACTPHPVSTGSTAPSGRNLHDAIEAKANRKSDIEFRCQQMNPPIPPNILRHMDSFKAAIQISQPMNDFAWSVLQPRLLAQLDAAQQAEVDHVSRVASHSSKPADRRHQDVNSKEAKEAMDRDWEESQRPIRDRLNVIADNFINQDWDHGNAVTYENSPKFAADLLTYVRRIYYANESKQEPARLEQQASGPTTDIDTKPRLVLDDMKWVYDNKLKPKVEQFRKDIFLCNGSDCDRNTRFYGFEGVIQHFGARHTNAFSVGNVVVAWREAEWPEETPFHPDPISVKHAFHASTNSNGYTNHYSGYSRAGTSTPHMQPHLPQASPGPYNYGNQYNGPFAPPQAPSSAIPGFGYTQPYAAPVDSFPYQAMGTTGYGPQPGISSYMTSPAMINSAIAPPPTMAPPGQCAPDAISNGIKDAGHSTSSFDKQVSTVIKLAQDIWKQTSGIKDMPNSLRIYVLLHRTISKFHVEFNHEPNLTHFQDALSNHDIPKALKNASGLSCKACQAESSHQLMGAYYSKPEERKTYTVLNLFSHFRTQHSPHPQSGPSQGQQAALLDWKEDMIELPSERFISGLIHAPGMDDEKLLMIATVFPSLFPMPLPRIGVVDSHGIPSPASSGHKDVKDKSHVADTPSDALDGPEPASLASTQPDLPAPLKPMEDEYDPLRPALTTQVNESSSATHKKHLHRESPPTDRRQRYYAEPRYYVGCLQDFTERNFVANKTAHQMSREHMDDGPSRPREYVEYATSPRMINTTPAYDEYSGRRTVFREQERFYGPPQDEVIYANPRGGSHGREYSNYPRQVQYYEEVDQQPEFRYTKEPRSRDASPSRGQSAADRFLDDLVPGQTLTSEPNQPPHPVQPEPKPSVPAQEAEDESRYTPRPPSVPTGIELSSQRPSLVAPPPKPPSTVSNGSRYEDYRPNGRHVPTPDSGGPPRRPGPHRRRDRPHEHRMHSRYYRYLSVARDDPYGRAASMSRAQSRRYEEQRRRIDQQETPQPNADRDYEPAYSRDPSVDQHSPEDSFYHHTRLPPREYVSVQDRLHAYSPPRYRYDEPRGPQPVYVNQYGQPLHEYEIIRVRGDPRQQRGQYHQPPRYDPEHYQYVPVSYERPAPQRYNSRPEEYMYYEERERPLPRRPAPDAESEIYEPPPPEIKVESAPVPLPEGP